MNETGEEVGDRASELALVVTFQELGQAQEEAVRFPIVVALLQEHQHTQRRGHLLQAVFRMLHLVHQMITQGRLDVIQRGSPGEVDERAQRGLRRRISQRLTPPPVPPKLRPISPPLLTTFDPEGAHARRQPPAISHL